MKALEGSVALVTGASRQRGIGAAICHELGDHGAAVFFTHWSPYDDTMPWGSDADAPEQLAASLAEGGIRCAHASMDLSRPAAAVEALDAAERSLGAVSILVNNATHSTRDGFERLDAATLDAHYAVNIRGTFLLSVEFARRFAGAGGGRIINLTTGISHGPMPRELAYASTKAAVEGFTVTLAAEVASRGITVNAVNPGVTNSGWLESGEAAAMRSRFPRKRLGEPEDAARLVRFLASPDAEWITGQVIHSDGGFRPAFN